MNTKVIAGFPGVGKTYFKSNTKLNVLDSDSSKFTWLSKLIRNPDFPNNYIEHIKDNIGKVDIILVSTHKAVRDALVENKIPFTLVYPAMFAKKEYLKRYKHRGSDKAFVEAFFKYYYYKRHCVAEAIEQIWLGKEDEFFARWV